MIYDKYWKPSLAQKAAVLSVEYTKENNNKNYPNSLYSSEDAFASFSFLQKGKSEHIWKNKYFEVLWIKQRESTPSFRYLKWQVPSLN